MNLHTLSILKTRDAALIYEFLASRFRAASGKLTATSYERLATMLNGANMTTSRGARFTESVLRTRIAELEAIGLVVRSNPNGPAFDLEIGPERASNDASGSVQNENENDNEKPTEREKDATRPQVDIKINKQTFKTSMEPNPSVQQPAVSQTVASVDLTDERCVRLRRAVVRDVYEYGVRADLIDRAVAAVALGYASASDLRAAVRLAKEERATFERTNGFKGERRLWRAFCPIVKSWYDANGVLWDATEPRLEPRPAASIALDSEETALRVDAERRQKERANRRKAAACATPLAPVRRTLARI